MHCNPLVEKATVTDMSGGDNGDQVTRKAFIAVDNEEIQRPGRVPFEKGFSQMDWLIKSKRTSREDMTGISRDQQNREEISMAEVMRHNREEDGWVVLGGKVYNISPYLRYHPGGAKVLKSALGKDCTALFKKYHAWVNYEMLLEKCFIGHVIDT